MQHYDFHRLIPMTSFVIDYYSHEGYADLQTLQLMKNYANFLKQPLSLWMFVPTNSDGELIKLPEGYDSWKNAHINTKTHIALTNPDKSELYKDYDKAAKNILFEGFEIAYNGYSVVRIIASYDESIELSFKKDSAKFDLSDDVESLTKYDEIYLSPASIKLIGFNKKI